MPLRRVGGSIYILNTAKGARGSPIVYIYIQFYYKCFSTCYRAIYGETVFLFSFFRFLGLLIKASDPKVTQLFVWVVPCESTHSTKQSSAWLHLAQQVFIYSFINLIVYTSRYIWYLFIHLYISGVTSVHWFTRPLIGVHLYTDMILMRWPAQPRGSW